MKKVLSLIMTVALLLTMLPTVIAQAESTTDQPIRVAISADVPLDGSSATSYGKTNIGTTSDMLFRRPQADKAYPTPLLFKTDFSGFELPEGKVIEKAEFFMYSISEQSGCTGYTADIDIYNASTDWEEDTTVLLDWCDDKKDTADLMKPDMLSQNPDDLYYADFTSTPDVSYNTAFNKINAGSGDTQLVSFDITNVFKAAYPSGTIEADDELAWIVDIRKCNAYRYMCIASKEHANTELHPYVEITLSDKPSMYVTSSSTPENAQADFVLSTSNAIDSYSVSVNGEAVIEGITVATNTITLDYNWVLGEEYTVVVNATDYMGQAIPEQTYTFTVTDSYIFPITHDTTLHAYNNSSIPGSYGEEIHGDLTSLELRCPPGATSRGIGVLRTDALAGLKTQLDSGKMIEKVELLAYLAPGSCAINTSMRFFPASSDWDESTMYLMKWCDENYLPNLTWSGVYGGFDEDATPTDEYTYNYPAVSEGYVPMTYDITNTFNAAFESGVADDSVFSFMMARGEISNYNYVLLASSEAEGFEPVIKVTLKEKKYETKVTTDFTNTAYALTSSGSSAISGGGETAYYFPKDSESYGSSAVVAYTMPLPTVDNGKFLESFKLKFCESHSYAQRDCSHAINMYRFIPEGEVDLTTFKFSDVADYAVKENRTGSVRATGVYTIRPGTVEGGHAHSYIEYEADLTEYAYDCLNAGKTEMIVLMNCDYALKFVGTSGYSGTDENAVGSQYIASIASNPEITLDNANLDVGGSMVDKAEFKFRTQFTDGAENLAKLYKGDTPVEEAVFMLTPSKTKIVMNPITLDENASYKIVLGAGARDLFDNTSEEEILLAEFETITNLTIAVPKIVYADFDSVTGSFADAQEIGADIAAGTQIKAITEITNNTSRNDEIFVVIVSYKDGEIKEISSVGVESIGITKKATKIYTSETITLEEDCSCVKAFVWAQNKIVPLSVSRIMELN